MAVVAIVYVVVKGLVTFLPGCDLTTEDALIAFHFGGKKMLFSNMLHSVKLSLPILALSECVGEKVYSDMI